MACNVGPVYETLGIMHYCVTNVPGAYPRSSTQALTEAVLAWALRLADQGLQALRDDSGFGKVSNTYQGFITCQPVAEALGFARHFRSCSRFFTNEA